MIYQRKEFTNKVCDYCKEPYKTRVSYQKFCKPICSARFYNRLYGRPDPGSTTIPSGTVGTMAELAVSLDLLSKGYAVFRSLSPACYCDVIASKDGNLLEMEIRTGYTSPTGKLSFPKKLHGHVSNFAVYDRTTKIVLYLDTKYNPIEI